MSEQSLFIEKASERASNEVHRKKLLKVIQTYDTAVIARKESQFRDWEDARKKAAAVKDFTLKELPTLLEQFEKRISERGAKVLWAKDTEEAQRYLLEIVKTHGVRSVVKSKSMTTEEVGVNELLEHNGFSVYETDLGELIVQLAGEKPYHIVTPCMHKSKAEISDLFHEKLGTPQTDSAEDLARAARVHLRQKFIRAELGITGANFLIADEGAVHILENEGNARLSVSCPKVHVAIAGIEKVLPRLADLEFFLPLLTTSGTGQQLTAYQSIIRGPRGKGELDGPEAMYVILLDNGRSKLYADPDFRESLRCIRCGACLNACPVYKTVGGHAYHTTYPGPIGAVITPHLKGSKEWHHLAYASSLCGACSDVCPVNIPLHHMILKNRIRAASRGEGAARWRFAIGLWGEVASSRWIVEFGRPVGRIVFGLLSKLSKICGGPELPKLARRSFASETKKDGFNG